MYAGFAWSKNLSRPLAMTAKDGGNAVRLSGTISADRQGWWKCSKIVWNNLCLPCRQSFRSCSRPLPTSL
ncbi:MAG: hypothetical protein HFP76_03950 [Methylococcales symbiont of Iophon sp. n. MRB-2018]|nr:MAG: hypothetical protein HFP76_03950 [Methylococcales symbiont of Iophon sp. n. MRB-2018]